MARRRDIIKLCAGAPVLSVISGNRKGKSSEINGDTDWGSFKSNGGNIGYTTKVAGPRVEPKEEWSDSAASGGAFGYQTPVLVDGVLYVSGGGRSQAVVSYDAMTGGERWRWLREEDEDSVGTRYSGITYADNAVFFKLSDNEFISLNATDGSERWRTEESVFEDPNPPATDGELVFFDTFDYIYAYNASDGAEQWRVGKDENGVYPMAVSDGTLFYEDDRSLFAVSTDDGSEKWEHGGPVEGAPVATDSIVAVPTGDGVQMINAETGIGEWQFSAEGDIESPPAIAEETMYVHDDEAVYAVDIGTREVLWNTELDVDDDRYGPITDGETVYVSIDPVQESRAIVALDATSGEKLWRNDETPRGPVLGENRLYFNSGGITALEGPAQQPTASFSYEPNTPEQRMTVEFDASESSVTGSQISTYDWDFNDTGTVDTQGERVEYEVTEAGEFPVRLTVTSDDGETDDIRRVLEVDPRFDDLEAGLSLSPEQPVAGETVILDATDSVPAENIVSFEWRITGDASLTDQGERVTKTLDPGSYKVRLRVVDEQGRESEETKSLDVRGSEGTNQSEQGDNDEADGPSDSADDDEAGSSDESGVEEEQSDRSNGEDDEQPGFGVGSALAGAGGLAYLLQRRVSDENNGEST